MKRGALILACMSLAWAQHLSDADAAAMVEKSREKALTYAHSLPDFVCTEVIHRYTRNSPQAVRSIGRSLGNMSVPAALTWLPTDKLTVKLSYFQQQEEHKLILLNDKPTGKTYETLIGGVTTGEFGGTLKGIFDRDTSTEFHWESWKNVRRRRVAVYGYNVDAAHSHYEVVMGTPADFHKAIVPFHGVIEIDRETGEVLHFTYIADDIPRDVGLDEASTIVDYDFADVGGRGYLLPARSETEMHSPKLSVRNDTEFREYRKFSADSSIEFGVGK